MVTIFFPATLFIGVTQLRAASPSICTVQAPQSPLPQPYLVPVRCSSSRRYHNSGISGSPVKERVTPLTVNAIFFISPPFFVESWKSFSAVAVLIERSRESFHSFGTAVLKIYHLFRY